MLKPSRGAARQGFEPQYADPKSAVLPLDDRANSKGLCYFTRKFDKRECSTLDYGNELIRNTK